MTQNPLDKFKHSLEQQGFNSPMLTTLAPQEICGVVLDGELELLTNAQNTIFTKHDIFYINGGGSFEIHCGSNGAQYLFSFKNSPPKAC
jgi:ethanolamine utilization protein EutQ (cupin superfamily)